MTSNLPLDPEVAAVAFQKEADAILPGAFSASANNGALKIKTLVSYETIVRMLAKKIGSRMEPQTEINFIDN